MNCRFGNVWPVLPFVVAGSKTNHITRTKAMNSRLAYLPGLLALLAFCVPVRRVLIESVAAIIAESVVA